MGHSITDIIKNIMNSEPIYAFICISTGIISNWSFQAFIFVTATISFTFFKQLYKANMKNINIIICFMFFICFIYIREFSMVIQGMSL